MINEKPTISVVMPAFNESEIMQRSLQDLQKSLEEVIYLYEIIIVDDGSTDNTSDIVSIASSKDRRIRLIRFSRNFGKEAALAAGLEYSKGDCIVFLDADLQHPPSLIVDMLAKWEQGYEVVNARKAMRGHESSVYKGAASLFNHWMGNALGSEFTGASDYKLIDREVAEALKLCPERNRFFRGLVSWVGFQSTDIEFDVADRLGGDTKWSKMSLVKYSLSSLIAFSSMPLRVVAYTGFFTTGLGLLLLAQTLYNYLTGRAITGFTTVISVQILLGGMILIALGVIAIYIGKIYQEQKARPVFIVKTDKDTALKE